MAAKYNAAVAEQDADFFEVMICEMRKRSNRNAVLLKTLRILGHAESFEPVSNLLHTGSSAAHDATSFELRSAFLG
jgi:hypothetical protein